MTTAGPSPHAQSWRALVLAAVASGGATVAHAVGGGHLVSGTGVLVATALLTGATLPFVRGRVSAVRAAVLLVALQVGAHAVHGLSAMAAGSPVHGPGRAGVPTHAAHGIRPLGRIDTGGVHGTGASAIGDLLPSPTMLVAHAVAAVVVGLVLTRGEQSWVVACTLLAAVGAAAARVLRVLARRALALWHVLATTCAGLTGPRTEPSDGPAPTDVWHARTPVRRGPPALLLT